jgi:uncharacterized protein (DUF58 family)
VESAPTVVPVEREELLPAGILASVVLGGAAVALGRPILALVAFAVTIVLGLGLLWLRFGFYRVRYWRQLQPDHVFPGEPVTLSLVLENAKPLPLPWVEVVEELPAALVIEGQQLEPSPKPERKVLRTLLSVGIAERVQRRYPARARRRGFYRLGPARLTTGDPFGLARARLEIEPGGTLLVYPEIRPLESFGLPAEHPLGDATPCARYSRIHYASRVLVPTSLATLRARSTGVPLLVSGNYRRACWSVPLHPSWHFFWT